MIRIHVTTVDGVVLDTFSLVESETARPEELAALADESTEVEALGSVFANASLLERLWHSVRLTQ